MWKELKKKKNRKRRRTRGVRRQIRHQSIRRGRRVRDFEEVPLFASVFTF